MRGNIFFAVSLLALFGLATARAVVPSNETPAQKLQRQIMAEAAQTGMDLFLIADLLKAHPELGNLLLNPPRTGTALQTIQTHAGTQYVQLQGPEIRLKILAQAVRRSRTVENQRIIYKMLRRHYPANAVLGGHTLPPTEQILGETADALIVLNSLMAGSLTLAPSAPDTGTRPAMPGLSCEGDIGRGADLDTGGVTNPASDPHPYSSRGLYANFDWKLKRHDSCIKDQGKRGSCAAFGTIGAIENAVSQLKGKRVNLSEQALYFEGKYNWSTFQSYHLTHDGYPPMTFFDNFGASGYVLPFEREWNYNPASQLTVSGDPNNPSATNAAAADVGFKGVCSGYREYCSETAPEGLATCRGGDGPPSGLPCDYLDQVPNDHPGIRVTEYVELAGYWTAGSSAARLIADTVNTSPVVAGIQVSPSFRTPDSNGFIANDPNESVESWFSGHIIELAGFVRDSDVREVLPNAPRNSGGGYFIVKNSWGRGYGDGGYAYLPYAYIVRNTLSAVAVTGVDLVKPERFPAAVPVPIYCTTGYRPDTARGVCVRAVCPADTQWYEPTKSCDVHTCPVGQVVVNAPNDPLGANISCVVDNSSISLVSVGMNAGVASYAVRNDWHTGGASAGTPGLGPCVRPIHAWFSAYVSATFGTLTIRQALYSDDEQLAPPLAAHEQKNFTLIGPGSYDQLMWRIGLPLLSFEAGVATTCRMQQIPGERTLFTVPYPYTPESASTPMSDLSWAEKRARALVSIHGKSLISSCAQAVGAATEPGAAFDVLAPPGQCKPALISSKCVDFAVEVMEGRSTGDAWRDVFSLKPRCGSTGGFNLDLGCLCN